MKEIEKIASDLFNKIRNKFEGVSLGDENAKSTTDPEQARFFNFEYAMSDDESGNVTISIIDSESIRVYFGTDITDAIEDNPEMKEEWYGFLRGIRKFAKRNMMNFDTRDIAKSNLQLKDIKQQTKSDSNLDTDDLNITESRLYGTSRHSFADIGECKLRIIHSDTIDEETRGSRARKIEAIFVETPMGERFLLSHKNLTGAAAMATHINNGGQPHDDIAEAINGMVAEMASMKHFVRSIKRRTDLDSETNDMAASAVDRYNELKQKLKRLRSPRHYLDFVENYMPESSVEDEYDVDALRERFVKKMYDDRFDEALPFVYRAYQKKQKSLNSPMGDEFESWAESMLEGTWAVPNTESEKDDLRELMSKPLMVGNEGQDATTALYNIIGDDQLFDDLGELANIKGPEYDCRPEVIRWLKSHFPALGQEMEEVVKQSEEPEQPAPGAEPVLGTPQPAEQQAAAPAAPAPEEEQQQPPAPQPTAESSDPLEFIRKLAGLSK